MIRKRLLFASNTSVHGRRTFRNGGATFSDRGIIPGESRGTSDDDGRDHIFVGVLSRFARNHAGNLLVGPSTAQVCLLSIRSKIIQYGESTISIYSQRSLEKSHFYTFVLCVEKSIFSFLVCSSMEHVKNVIVRSGSWIVIISL